MTDYGAGMDMCTDMCVHMRIGMFLRPAGADGRLRCVHMDVCTDRLVYRQVHRHVCTHVHSHVPRRANADDRVHCMCMGTCIAMHKRMCLHMCIEVCKGMYFFIKKGMCLHMCIGVFPRPLV